MDRASKKALAEEYQKVFLESEIGVLVESEGLTVEQATKVRQSLYPIGSRMKILKNRVAKLAASETEFKQISENFVNMKALIYSDKDPLELVKAVSKLSGEIEPLKLSVGLMKSGKAYSKLSAEELVQLSKLPSKEELIAKLLFLMNAPVTNLARTLNEIPAGFVRVLQSVADKKN